MSATVAIVLCCAAIVAWVALSALFGVAFGRMIRLRDLQVPKPTNVSTEDSVTNDDNRFNEKEI